VWDAVEATQPVYEGTVIPRSFKLTAGESRVWVHGNATEHMAEYAASMLNRSVSSDMVSLGSQQQIRSLQAAVEAATANGVPYGKLIEIGGWELKFAAPRAADQLPVLFHALPR
jgi:filamentous hemagglutinin